VPVEYTANLPAGASQ